MSYNPILDNEIDPESPVTQSLLTRYRDNLLAVADGDPSAPSINPAALTVGGKGTDGDLNNASVISSMGYYEFDEMEVTAPQTLPPVSIIRIAGDAVLSSTLTVSCLSRVTATNAAQLLQIEKWLGGFVGNPATGSGSIGGGGGGAGAGGSGFGIGGAALSPSGLSRPWVTRRPFVGGNGYLTSGGSAGLEWGPGGGCTIIVIDGDLDATGGTIAADGGHTNDDAPGASQPGAGGAGMLLVIVTGTITGGTFAARGGNANQTTGAGDGGGGGGGYVQLVASAYAGSQTLVVTGGSSDVAAGSAGVSNQLTMTRDQIRTLLQRL